MLARNTEERDFVIADMVTQFGAVVRFFDSGYALAFVRAAVHAPVTLAARWREEFDNPCAQRTAPAELPVRERVRSAIALNVVRPVAVPALAFHRNGENARIIAESISRRKRRQRSGILRKLPLPSSTRCK